MNYVPDQSSAMDESLRFVWERLEPLPGDFRLIRGTALTLYFNHRESFDLDWLCVTSVLTIEEVFRMKAFEGAGEIIHADGGLGLVDCKLSPHRDELREISMTFMKPHKGFVHVPIQEPLVCPTNGVSVGHPLDLVIGKLMAISNRATDRDYRDLTYIAEQQPHILDDAIPHLGNFLAIAKKIARIPLNSNRISM